MSDRAIEFHMNPGCPADAPRPFPASKVLPEWLKKMPQSSADGSVDTVKRCSPFLDALGCGYIIPLVADVHIAVIRDGQQIRAELKHDSALGEIVRAHGQEQYPGSPFANMPVIKFLNPWIIKT